MTPIPIMPNRTHSRRAPRTGLAVAAMAGLAALAAACDPGPPDPTLFHTPIEGDNYADWFYGPLPNHVATAGQAEDYQCGTKAIDYRKATAFLIPSLRAMDQGVNVLAAYQGEVVESVDEYEDRNLSYEYNLPGNRVRIAHPDGLLSEYRNLRQGANTVEVGDRVETGQVIGQAGSSGDSNWPRVGFVAIDQDGEIFDPWAGPCALTESLWADQHDYPIAFTVIDKGTTDQDPTLATVASRPPDVTTFQYDQDITFWVHALNRPAGFYMLHLIGPEGATDSLAFAYPSAHPANTLFGGLIRVPAGQPAGDWALQYSADGQPFARLDFVITQASAETAGDVAGRYGDAEPRIRAGDGIWPEGVDRR